MNKKEISELSRRFKLEKSNISKIYGCYVNSKAFWLKRGKLTERNTSWFRRPRLN